MLGGTLTFSVVLNPIQLMTFTPYIEWQVTQTTANDPFLPAKSPRIIELNTNYYIGDYIINTTTTGGDGFIYKCTSAHPVTAQTDEFADIY